MKKYTAALAFFLLIFQLSAATGIEWSSLSLEKAIEQAKNEDKLVFIDVFATWCGPCKYLDKKVFPDAALSEFFNAEFINLEIDGERGEGPDLMRQFELSAFPTLLFLDGEGKLIRKQVGAMDAEELLKMARVVVDPTSSPIYQMQQRFDNGERDRVFLSKFLILLSEEQQDASSVAMTYLEEFSDSAGTGLSMDRQGDFLAFIFGIDDLEHPLMKEFLGDIVEYIKIDPNLTAMKIDRIFNLHMEKAVAVGDPEIGVAALRAMYPALTAAMEGDIAPVEEAEEKMRETLREMMKE
jgi:thioredoxin-related protein